MSTRTQAPATPDIRDSILDTVGDTPLVRLSRIGPGVATQIVAKVESFNPGGSIKDRVAIAMIEAAERDGRLRPGGTIIEPTSGNTGTGLAIAARLKGYRVIAVMPDKMSREKIDLLRAYGAEVVVAPTDVAPESPQSYYRVADRLTEEIPGAFQPNQYSNPANPQTHYASTGPELWGQTGGRITHLVVGVGTGGTITGTARYLKEQQPGHRGHRRRPGRLDLLRRGESSPYLVEGVGEDFWPATFDPDGRRPLRHGVRPRLVPHDPPARDDRGHARRRLVRPRAPRGAGGRARARRPRRDGRGDPPRRRARLPVEDLQRRLDDGSTASSSARSTSTVGDVLHGQARRRRDPAARDRADRTSRCATRSRCCTSTASRSCRWSARTTRDASSARSASAGCSATRSSDPALLDAEIVDVMEPPFPAVAATDPVREAVELLVGDRQALLVTEHGRPSGHRHPRRPAGGAGPMSRRSASRSTASASPPASSTPGSSPTRTTARSSRRSTRPRPTCSAAAASSSRTTTTRARRTRRAARSRRALGELEGGYAAAFSSGHGRRARADHRGLLGRRPHRAARTTSTAAPTGSSTRCSAAGA